MTCAAGVYSKPYNKDNVERQYDGDLDTVGRGERLVEVYAFLKKYHTKKVFFIITKP